jgi:hypothetical protein
MDMTVSASRRLSVRETGSKRGSSAAAEVVDSEASEEEARASSTLTHVARVRAGQGWG